MHLPRRSCRSHQPSGSLPGTPLTADRSTSGRGVPGSAAMVPACSRSASRTGTRRRFRRPARALRRAAWASRVLFPLPGGPDTARTTRSRRSRNSLTECRPAASSERRSEGRRKPGAEPGGPARRQRRHHPAPACDHRRSPGPSHQCSAGNPAPIAGTGGHTPTATSPPPGPRRCPPAPAAAAPARTTPGEQGQRHRTQRTIRRPAPARQPGGGPPDAATAPRPQPGSRERPGPPPSAAMLSPAIERSFPARIIPPPSIRSTPVILRACFGSGPRACNQRSGLVLRACSACRCPVLLIMRHGQRAELRCLKYLRRLGTSVVLPIMRQIDALSVLSHQVKGAGASSWRDADPDASHSRPLPRSG